MSSPIRPPLTVTEGDGNPSGRPINKIVVSNGTLTINGTTATITTGGSGGSGTVTNVSSTDSFISISNPNTTPVITIQDATTSQSGILTSTDWNTFNNKTANAGTVTSVGSSQAFVTVASATTTPSITIGNASGSATGVLTSTDWTTFNNKTSNAGTVTSVGSSQAFVTVASATTTPSITIGNASGSATGVLTSTDWTTFNNKQSSLTLTTQGSSGAATLVGSTLNIPQYSGGGGGTIGGSITDNKVAVGASTADDIEGYSDFTYNDSLDTLTVGEKIDSSGTSPLQLIAGNSSISILDGGVNNHINISPASGRINAQSSTLSVGTNAANSVISSRGAYDLTLNTNDGTNSGSIVIADGVDGQISITPNGAGTIKLDGVELDNSAIATGYVLKATSATAAGWAAESGGGVSFPLEGTSGSTSAPTYSFSADTDTGIFLGGASNMGLVAGGVSYINIGGLGIVELTRRLRNVDGTAALPSYSFSGDTDTGIYTASTDELNISLGGTRVFDFQKNGNAGKLQFRGSAPIIECDDAGADLSLRSGGSTYAEILIQNENSNIDIKPAGTGKVKISNAYTLPSVVTAANDYVLTAQTDGSTAWAAAGGGGGGITWSTPVDSTLTPDTSATYDLGTSTVLFRSGYFSSSVSTGSLNVSGNITRPNGSMKITAGGSQDSRAHIFLPNNETNMKMNGSSSSKTDIILDTRWNDASNTATIQLKTKGQTRFQVGASGELYVGTDAGTSGQVLTSGGAGAVPTWEDAGAASPYPITMATAISVSDDTFVLTSFPPYTRSVTSTGSQSIDTSVYYIPFVPPKNTTLTNLQINITTAGTGNLSMALYDSDNVGNPNDLLSNSTVTIDASSTGYYTSTMASSQNLSGLTLYYIAITMSANSCQVRSHPSAGGGGSPTAPISGLDSFNEPLLFDSTTTTLPSSVTPSQLSTKYGLCPLIGGGF